MQILPYNFFFMRVKFLLFFAPVLLATSCSYSQQDLLAEAEDKLESGTTVSEILMDKKFESIHSETAFRDLIQKFAPAQPVRITSADEPGKLIQVQGKLVSEQGHPVSGITIYFYQTDERGWYLAERPHVGGNSGDQRHARLFGYVKTNDSGEFEIQTIKPSGYPGSDLPAHIHFEIHDPEGYQPLVNEFLFDDDERLVGNIREQSLRYHLLIAKPGKGQPPYIQSFKYTIVLKAKK
jgi:protocatechuate 3,4-dioxygenase beta subunit